MFRRKKVRLLKKKGGKGLYSLIPLCIGCLRHLSWGYAEPAEEGDEYRYYDSVDELW